MTDYGKGDQPILCTDESGREYYEYPSGLTKWRDTGHFRTAPALTPISADPRGMLLKRNEKSRQIAREAIDEGAGIDASLWGTGEGWRKQIAHASEVALKSNNIRGLGELLAKLAQLAGYTIREEGEGKNPVHIDNLNIQAAPTALKVLIDAIELEQAERITRERIDVILPDSPKPEKQLR